MKLMGSNAQREPSVGKEVFLVAYPAVLESIFVALTGIVDVYMVSGMSSEAVAAVGLTTHPKFVGLALFTSLSTALSALVARRRGQRDQKSANEILVTALAICLLGTAVVSAICVGFAGQFMKLCGSMPDTHDMAVTYFRIIMGGIFFTSLSMTINAAQRGSGNTKIAMQTNVVSNLVNVIGNYLLIHGNLGFPALGVKGAAIATVIGSAVACVMSILSLFHKDNFVSIYYVVSKRIAPAMESLRSLVQVGYSVFVESILTRVGFMATSLMAADMGTKAMAAHQVGMNMSGVSCAIGSGMQVAAVALIGRSLGEGNPNKAKQYGRYCLLVGEISSLVMAVWYFFGGRGIMSLFFQDVEVIDIGVGVARVLAVIVLVEAAETIYLGCLRGAGDTRYVAIASTICITIIRPIACYIFTYPLGFGMNGVWMGVLVDQFSRFLFGFVRYQQGKWVKIRI